MSGRAAFLRQQFANLPLRVKLMLFFSATLITSALFIVAVVYRVVSEEFEAQVRRSAELSFSQACDFVEKTVGPMEYAANGVFFNADVADVLTRNAEAVDTDISGQYRDMVRLQNFLNVQSQIGEILQVRLYVSGELTYSKQDVYFDNIAELPRWQYESLKNTNRSLLWLAPEELLLAPGRQGPQRVVSLLRKLTGTDDYSKMLGVVRVVISADMLDEILYKSSITKMGVAFLINARKEVVACSDYGILKSFGLREEELSSLAAKPYIWENRSFGGHSFLVQGSPVGRTDWSLVALVPIDELTEPGLRAGFIMVGVLLTALLVAFICAYLFSGWFTKRLRRLAKNMVGVRAGILDMDIHSADTDEVGMLYDSFNYMLSEIRKLSKQQYENGRAIQSAELRVLQAQINPHFLYNSLDLVNWEALEAGAPRIAEIAQALADFYKMSLRRGQDVVRLSEELQHVQSYVRIQNYRFEERIRLITDMPESLLGCRVPKLLLQPLVENAILHGIAPKPDGYGGVISVTAKVSGGLVRLAVTDDGVGMKPEARQTISALEPDAYHGMGARNIDQRLKLHFGAEYGLRYETAESGGTSAILEFPAQ